MAEIKTAREMLAQTKKNFFKGVDLVAGSKLEGDERRAFKLAQVERLLTEMHGLSPLGMWLSDQFWTADEGREPMPWGKTDVIPEPGYKTNPLLSLNEQQTLTDKEMGRLRLILEVAGLCHDLSLHFTFDLKEAFGVKNDWWVSNKQLVKWLTTTPYERIAMHVAYIMRKHAIDKYEYRGYLPAQDALAELFSSEYHELVREPDCTEMPPRGYVKTIIDKLLYIERHWQRGQRLKLNPEVVKLHDEIFGMVPRQFNKDVLKVAQILFDYMDEKVYGILVHIFPDQLLLDGFVKKVREVRDQYLPKGWIADNSLEFNYLIAHAERCGCCLWREEDYAL